VLPDDGFGVGDRFQDPHLLRHGPHRRHRLLVLGGDDAWEVGIVLQPGGEVFWRDLGRLLGDGGANDTNSWNMIARHSGSDYTGAVGSRLVGGETALDFEDGQSLASTVVVRFERAGGATPTPELPFIDVDFLVMPVDSDGVPAQASTHVQVGDPTDLYFGRAVIESAFGPDDRSLPVWAHTEYCTALSGGACSQWADLNSAAPVLDDCTVLRLQAPVVDPDTEVGFQGCWTGGNSYGGSLVDPLCSASFMGVDPLRGRGGAGWLLNYIGGGAGGTYTVPHLQGGATLNNYHPYLILQQGTVNFGTYRGNDRVIYWRELRQ